jgi:rsbT antagonist protein RsbS
LSLNGVRTALNVDKALEILAEARQVRGVGQLRLRGSDDVPV